MPGTMSQHIPKELLTVVLENRGESLSTVKVTIKKERRCLGKLGSGK